jgi:hypothetical protein
MSDSSNTLSLNVHSVNLRSSVKATSNSKGSSIRFSYLFIHVVTSQPTGRLQTRRVSLWRVELEIQKREHKKERRNAQNRIGLSREGNKARLVKVKFHKLGGATIKTWFYQNEERIVMRELVSRIKEIIMSEVPFFRERNSAVLFMNVFVCFGHNIPQWARASSFTNFLDHTQRRTTVGRTPLDEWSDRCRDLYLTTHNTHNRQTSMPPLGFEPTIWAGERPQTYASERAATGTGYSLTCDLS